MRIFVTNERKYQTCLIFVVHDTSDKNPVYFSRTLGFSSHAIGHEWHLCVQLALVCAGLSGAFTPADSDWIWTETGLGLDFGLRSHQTVLALDFPRICDVRGQLYFNFCFTGAHCCPLVQCKHGNQSISSPKSVRLRSHLLESDLSFFPAHLD